MEPEQTVREHTDLAIADATWLTDADAGTVAVLRKLADTIDDPYFPIIADRFDNVSIPTYLRFAAALGLTPVGRKNCPPPPVARMGRSRPG